MADQVAAGNVDSHVIDIAVDGAERTEPLAELAADNHCHVIDIDDVARTTPLECAVCMEPLEWVAVGPCGHREVCSKCTVHVRFAGRDHRCCICRELCPTVVVTKAAGGRRVYTKLASLATFEGPVGNYWYHSGSAVYFDDEQQYEATRRACLSEDVADENHTPAPYRCPPVVLALLYLAFFFLMGVASSVVFTMDDKHWRHRVAILLGNGFVFAGLGSVIWFFIDWVRRDRSAR